MSRLIQPHDVVEAAGALKMRGGVEKGADAITVNRVLDPVGRAKNQGNLGITALLTRLFFKKSGRVGLWIRGLHIWPFFVCEVLS